MERDRDTSGGIGRWEQALHGIWVVEYGADGLGAATKSNEQVLALIKAKPHEEDLLTAGYRSMIWAHPSKGWRRGSLSGRLRGFGGCLMRNRGSM